MADQLSSHPVGHNGGIEVLKGVSQAEFLGWLTEMQQLDDDVAAAVDRRKAYLADIRQRLGKDEFASFKSVRKDAEMPGEARERRELSRRRMMQWLNKPLGHQPTLDFASNDEDAVAVNVHELHQIDGHGLAAGKNGHRRETNPWTPGTEQAQRWDNSWLRGQAAIADTLAAPPNGAAEQPQVRRRGAGRPPGSRNRPKADDLEGAADQVH